MKILNRSIITLFLVVLMLLGAKCQVFAQVAADIKRPRVSTPVQNENKRGSFQNPAQVTYTEDFSDPLGDWLNGWFYLNSNAENYYTAGGFSCDPNFRGNQPEGLWISDDRGCGTMVVQSPVRINFFNNFGDDATSFSMDHFTCVDGVTINIYDKSGALVSSGPVSPSCFSWSHYSVVLSNGISAFEYSYTGGQVEGNTSIDNVTLVKGDSTTIKGHVTDANTGAPIGQAVVIALQKPIKLKTQTSSDGSYEIPGLSPGTWKVLCRKSGYNFALQTVTLGSGETKVVDFNLTPKAANSRDDEIPSEFRDAVNAAPALSSKHTLTTTWGAIKSR